MKAIQIEEFGGPEVMQVTEVPDPESADGQVVVEVVRAGINFADTHVTRNDYLARQELPLIPGGEIAGRTPDGRRVAALLPSGGYAQKFDPRHPGWVQVTGTKAMMTQHGAHAAPGSRRERRTRRDKWEQSTVEFGGR